MKDRYLIALIVGSFVAWIAIIHFFLIDRRPMTYKGLPSGATCPRDYEDVVTCVGDGQVFTCVRNWRTRTAQCALAPRSP